ncbi:MAG: glycosyltransferase family 2 protein [Clostridia bacterium]|nr:glycosyltransferase family 2 protein [Clostridia bacterium]
MKISILTPTYNRAKLLNRLYKSLVENTKYNVEIEWLIMDDGSNDNTSQEVEKFIKENKFDIQYYSQENKGKMVAINNLIGYATGDLIIECDSDDYFKNNAFLTIKNTFNEMDDNTYALCYLKYDQNECNIGNLFKQKETTMFDLYFKQGEDGEKVLVYNAKIRKQFSYELENNEKFITEARMYHKMDMQYKIKCFNEPIMICEYQEEGYSKNIIEVFKKNPFGYYQYFKEIFEHDFKGVLLKKRIYAIKHYILFSVLTNHSFIETIKQVKVNINKLLFVIAYLPGKMLTKRKFK